MRKLKAFVLDVVESWRVRWAYRRQVRVILRALARLQEALGEDGHVSGRVCDLCGRPNSEPGVVHKGCADREAMRAD